MLVTKEINKGCIINDKINNNDYYEVYKFNDGYKIQLFAIKVNRFYKATIEVNNIQLLDEFPKIGFNLPIFHQNINTTFENNKFTIYDRRNFITIIIDNCYEVCHILKENKKESIYCYSS